GGFVGLLAGKPLGIFLGSWLAVKAKIAAMPEGSSWKMLLAVACLGGIGFTMSIFVDTLAFSDAEIINRGKIAILLGSFASALLGSLLILLFSRKNGRA
ncbi:MAG: Na+/H+ antiporter NhaA, partial [Alistipes sp.]|nr:Na+/H+ antiporter NhaA [Alistipes sp.]